MTTYKDELSIHYKTVFQGTSTDRHWLKGPFHELGSEFSILEFSPDASRDMCVYATAGLGPLSRDGTRIELHIYSQKFDPALVELLTITAHYHATGEALDLGDSVNFGKPWQDKSLCTFGYISLPHLYGPDLEDFTFGNKLSKCYWLVPITAEEVSYKREFGIDALEEKFEESNFNYLNPYRRSVL
ncbi:suppressor of fused domain protein [Dyadobacter sp. BHUBP1]|uniref:suppressor of fused domain protein n=1 Tax=Dyadobacter sp. BHUBP1 TaxID=3424178 RepID=UPI003D3276B6